jgi:hypothetical protein
MGLLGIISHINQLCRIYNVQDGIITIGCDGQGAIETIQAYSKCTSSYKHFDLISSIHASIGISKNQTEILPHVFVFSNEELV